MDLLGEDPVFDVGGSDWKIYSRSPIAPPEYLGVSARVENSMIALGCEIDGSVEHSLLSEGVRVEEGALVRDSVVMAGSVIKRGAVVENAIIAENVTVREGASVGERKSGAKGIAVLGRNITVSAGAKVEPGKILDGDFKGENE